MRRNRNGLLLEQSAVPSQNVEMGAAFDPSEIADMNYARLRRDPPPASASAPSQAQKPRNTASTQLDPFGNRV